MYRKIPKIYSRNKKIHLILIFLLAVLLLSLTQKGSGFLVRYEKTPKINATQTEAFEEIVAAFNKIKEATNLGLGVKSLTKDLNVAIDYYDREKYDQAYNKALEVQQEASELISRFRVNNILPFILIPINVILVAGLIVFFGRDVYNWYKQRRNEEFKDLEIVYDEKVNEN
ncbi:MAG: hypothetical protein GF308_03750 [Candidatus Heimdallarchaeota archaeon]|nr:hypothetical protein [Candidatus Heimdallarchaeota archaeon]